MAVKSKVARNIEISNTLCTKDYFETLPDELIVHIFKFLKNYEELIGSCSVVCKRWNKLFLDPALWRFVRLSCDNTITISKLKKVLSFGVQHLVILCGTWAERGNQELKNDNRNTVQYSELRCITFSMSRMPVDIFANLISSCFNLTEIHLYSEEINDSVCQYIARNKNLKKLSLFCIFGNVTAAGMSKVLNSCTKIKTISFSHTNFSEEIFTTIFDAIPQTSAIKLMFLGNSDVLDEHVETITVRCPELVTLNMLFCSRLTSSSIKFIINGLSKLQHLFLFCSKSLLPQSLLQLQYLHSLTNLTIRYEFDELEEPFPIAIKERLQKLFVHFEITNNNEPDLEIPDFDD